MIDTEAIANLVAQIEDGTLHHGECAGWQASGFRLTDCTCPMANILGAMRALLAEVERLSGDCSECGEMHKTHPTREGAVGWQGHTCRCVRCLQAEVELLRRTVEIDAAERDCIRKMAESRERAILDGFRRHH